MELKIYNTQNKESGSVKLPPQFSEDIRIDLIKRAVEAVQSHHRQAYGSDPRAGMKAAAKLSRRRRDYKGGYGKGLARVPRKTMVRRGMQMIWVGAFVSGTVKGRRAFPPVTMHAFAQKINDKERKKAIRSALSAAVNKELVKARGHQLPAAYPFAVSDEFETISKTKEFAQALHALGLSTELERTSERSIRAGKGKLRGRKYKQATGPLLVVSGNCKTLKTAQNVPGVTVVEVSKINAELLAPGTHAGRLTLFTKSALQKIEKENLFM